MASGEMTVQCYKEDDDVTYDTSVYQQPIQHANIGLTQAYPNNNVFTCH